MTDEAQPEQAAEEPAGPDQCADSGRRVCAHVDIGAHGYVVSDTWLFGAQLGLGYDWFGLRVQGGPIFNDGLVERLDTAFLGPYIGGTLSGYFVRSAQFEARAGLGVLAFWLTEVSTELTYLAATVSTAGSWYFVPMVAAFVEVQVVPLSSKELDLGYVPALLSLGVEFTP